MIPLLCTLYVIGFLSNVFIKSSYNRYFFKPADNTETRLILLERLSKKACSCALCSGGWVIQKNTLVPREQYGYQYHKMCSKHYNELEIIKNTQTNTEYKFEWDDDMLGSSVCWFIMLPVFLAETGGQIYAEHLLKEKELRQIELAQNAKYLAEGVAEVDEFLMGSPKLIKSNV